MSEATNPYQSLHNNLESLHQQLEKLLAEKSECLQTVQQSKYPATQLPKIMKALENQHEWEKTMNLCLVQIIAVVGVAVDEVHQLNQEQADGAPA